MADKTVFDLYSNFDIQPRSSVYFKQLDEAASKTQQDSESETSRQAGLVTTETPQEQTKPTEVRLVSMSHTAMDNGSSQEQTKMYYILSSSLEITSGIAIQMIQPRHPLSESTVRL
ncbi:hypothetical protein BSL78_03885 [Apostichopus japonicus]|uniref:Uncharacterized protein n=1 Tax=Stichopus japonicus TaxID=307972 RepID=A0A2G8LG10_STIJA|nr:hypothetical protein BSL78_03885 [Apostichopus japonicus]